MNNRHETIHTLSLPALSNVCPSSDNVNELTAEKCSLSTATHFLVSRLHTRTVPSSLPENNWRSSTQRLSWAHQKEVEYTAYMEGGGTSRAQ